MTELRSYWHNVKYFYVTGGTDHLVASGTTVHRNLVGKGIKLIGQALETLAEDERASLKYMK